MRSARGPALAFSTLGCPEWDADTVVSRAAALGWDAIEWRGGPDGTVRPDWSGRRLRGLRRRLDDAGLGSVAVTAYTTFVSGDPAAIRRSIDDAVAHAEVASELGAPTIRVFLGEPDDAATPRELEDRAVRGLLRLLERVAPLAIGVAIEPHDAHVRSSALRPILDRVADTALGVVWDIGNAWSVGEAPAEGLDAYGRRIRYVQVKDGTGRDATWRLTGLGEGDVPIDDALAGLAWLDRREQLAWPPISFEWERAWHPELPPAEVALGPARTWLAARVETAMREGPTGRVAGPPGTPA